MTNVKMFDYRGELAEIHDQVIAAVERVLQSGFLILGPEVERFEKSMAESLGGGHAVGVANGTEALMVALLARGIGHGDEVITVANTAVPTANAIASIGATPVFCDIDPKTGLMNLAGVAALLSDRTRAIVPVHLYGNAVDITQLRERVARPEVLILEDCAQAQGATLQGRPVGSLGDVAAFSFYPTKNLGAYGDAGLCFTRNAELAEAMKRARRYGFSKRDYASGPGLNSRLDELHAAILSVKLPLLSRNIERRRQLAAVYDARLPAHVERLEVTPGCEHGRHLYVVLVDQREVVAARLLERGIESGVHYPHALHQMPAFAGARLPPDGLPHSERHAQRVLSLPLQPLLTESDVARVCAAL